MIYCDIFRFMLKKLIKILIFVACVLLYCEFIHYYVVLWLYCDWPTSLPNSSTNDVTRAIILSDPHLLGKRRGHWFDKLRREWQMQRAFASSIRLFTPNTVIILGDIFDEGDIAGAYFGEYAQRYDQLFGWADAQHIVTVGNHDIGFHYALSARSIDRFESKFPSSSGVHMRVLHGNVFVTINSMAMHADGCRLCQTAEKHMINISNTIKCWNDKHPLCGWDNIRPRMSQKKIRPIVLLHFPLYRTSDADCNEPDQATQQEKTVPFRPEWDCLSEGSTGKLIDLLHPRAVFNGHSHNGCTRKWPENFTEHTVSSFSWRNRNNPAFLLVVIDQENIDISKCLMPHETTVIYMYYLSGIILLIAFILSLGKRKPGILKINKHERKAS